MIIINLLIKQNKQEYLINEILILLLMEQINFHLWYFLKILILSQIASNKFIKFMIKMLKHQILEYLISIVNKVSYIANGCFIYAIKRNN